MELLRRMLRGAEATCDCGHLPAVHWRSEGGHRTWCSAPGCNCNQAAAPTSRAEGWRHGGDGFRLIERGARRKRSA